MSSSWYEINADECDHVLHISIYGNFCANGAMHLGRDIACKAKYLSSDYGMLLDLRRMIDPLGDRADIAMAWLLKVSRPETRLAIVDPTPRCSSRAMQGMVRSNVRVFADEPMAMGWLSGPKRSVAPPSETRASPNRHVGAA